MNLRSEKKPKDFYFDLDNRIFIEDNSEDKDCRYNGDHKGRLIKTRKVEPEVR